MRRKFIAINETINHGDDVNRIGEMKQLARRPK